MAQGEIIESAKCRRIARYWIIERIGRTTFHRPMRQANRDAVLSIGVDSSRGVPAGVLFQQGTRIESTAGNLDRLGLSQDMQVRRSRPARMLPDGAGRKRIVIARDQENRSLCLRENVHYLLNQYAIDGIVFECVAGDEQKIHLMVVGKPNHAASGFESGFANTRTGNTDMGRAHADLPICGMDKFHADHPWTFERL
jgi:hypothetical protein